VLRLLTKVLLWSCGLTVLAVVLLVEGSYRWGLHQARPLPSPPERTEFLLVHRGLWATAVGGPVVMEPRSPWTMFVEMWSEAPASDPRRRHVLRTPGAWQASSAARLLLREKRGTGQFRSNLEWHFYGVVFTVWFSRHFTAEQALVWSTDRTFFGCGVLGAEEAAHRFFGKPAAALAPDEVAVLAASARSPSLLGAPERLHRARDVALSRMQAEGLLTPEQARAARERPLSLRLDACRPREAE
jgi:hypothetical protein